jgi:GNAT superfamily N-acetyltransferase
VLTLRAAAPADVPEILALIRELADYERLLHEVDATPEGLHAALFGPTPRVFCDLAEQDGVITGFALWFYSFSTFRGRHGIYLEDLFVRPAMRGHGIGRALLADLAARCLREDLARLEWSVLDWNEPALAFYRTLGARGMTDWIPHRVTGEALLTLARGDPKIPG